MDLGDLPRPFDFSFAGDGIRDIFNVEHRPLGEVVLVQNGRIVPDPAVKGIVIDKTAGLVVFPKPPPEGEYWEVAGEQWRYFSDTDLQIFLDTALIHMGYGRGDVSGFEWTVGDVKGVEEYPISLYATIQALWALATDAAFDIDILAPDGVNIPRSERYRQLLDMIAGRTRQYEDMAAALNIGISAIEVYTARRTAKNTNRLVPVYLTAEYDDGSRPKRVLFPTPLQGSEAIKTGVATYDHHIISGDPYSRTLDFAFDLTGCEVKNAIRRALPHGHHGTVGPPVTEFTQTIVDLVTGQIRLSLTGAQTRSLPYHSYWEIQVAKPGEEARTKMRGMVYATNNEIVR
jgi:hypothetical protein